MMENTWNLYRQEHPDSSSLVELETNLTEDESKVKMHHYASIWQNHNIYRVKGQVGKEIDYEKK